MATPSATRASILALLHGARQQLLQSFQGLTEAQMLVLLPDGWSVKDILTHVAMWDEMELPDMRRAARGDARVLDGLDEDESLVEQWNDVQHQLRRRLPLSQVLAELEESRAAILGFLASVAEELLATGFVPAACAIQAEHDRDHGAQVHDWRQNEGI